MVDIGGGSTEICIGFSADIGMRYSFLCGGVVLISLIRLRQEVLVN
ncbi:MAG: hypothetical protein ACLUIQ_08850 [Dialister invisus]